ncbi:head decoration protein [Labrys portucalensis]|uniref:Head decoration protein n=1 Tax=Labrys neptuniae TaxID=376174 RepID=A0ABV6ZJX0_9HYPH
MPKFFTEGRHTGEFLLTEGPGSISREAGQLAPGTGTIKDGTFIGRVTATKQLVPHDPAATDGSQTSVGILLGTHHLDATVPIDAAFIARQAEVKLACLTFNAATDTPEERAAVLAQLDTVIAR